MQHEIILHQSEHQKSCRQSKLQRPQQTTCKLPLVITHSNLTKLCGRVKPLKIISTPCGRHKDAK